MLKRLCEITTKNNGVFASTYLGSGLPYIVYGFIYYVNKDKVWYYLR